jgi:hypothetical protein
MLNVRSRGHVFEPCDGPSARRRPGRRRLARSELLAATLSFATACTYSAVLARSLWPHGLANSPDVRSAAAYREWVKKRSAVWKDQLTEYLAWQVPTGP